MGADVLYTVNGDSCSTWVQGRPDPRKTSLISNVFLEEKIGTYLPETGTHSLSSLAPIYGGNLHIIVLKCPRVVVLRNAG